MLLIYNNLELEKISNFDIVCLSVLGLNLLQVFIEIVLTQMYENVHINLELRQAMKSLTRVEDLIKISLVCAFFFSTTLLVGLFAFEDQGCVRGYFEENSICKDCKAFVDQNCIDCNSRFACEMCIDGYFAIDRTCYSCSERHGENCEECTSGGCTKCKDEYFLSYGKCESCLWMQGCASDSCFEDGCR